MTCVCYTIGGPFIAEDPDCPQHGTDAITRRTKAYQLLTDSDKDEITITELRDIINKLVDIILDI